MLRTLALMISLAAAPLSLDAQPSEAPESNIGEGMDLLGEGARTLLRGLIGEAEPAMRNLAEQLGELNWQGLGITDLDDYEAPEVLENGDIILRRKTPEITVTPDSADDIEI